MSATSVAQRRQCPCSAFEALEQTPLSGKGFSVGCQRVVSVSRHSSICARSAGKNARSHTGHAQLRDPLPVALRN